MSLRLERGEGGALALYMGGDLQFDSRDERAYHEVLALPALALAGGRRAGPLRALICGGGDGLAARELLKSPRLTALDLVDLDPEVLALARSELSGLNAASLADPRVSVHVEDAWAFCERARDAHARYDVIVCDLTFPRELGDVAFSSVEAYALFGALLGDLGILAVNAVSPAATPDAFWAMYNGLRAAGLHPRPLHLPLPSFRAHGYGEDWGMLLASPTPLAATEFGDALPLAGPRATLRTPAQLRRLFRFPESSAARRAEVAPCRLGSDRMLRLLAFEPSFIEGGGTPVIEGGGTPVIEAGESPVIEAGESPVIEAKPTLDRVVGASTLDAPGLDTFGLDAPGLDTFGLDAPGLDTFGLDAPGLDTFGLDAPGLDTFGLDAFGFDALAFDVDPAPLPLPAEPGGLLPPEVRALLAAPERDEAGAVLARVLALLPGLGDAKREMAEAFLEAPARFLAGIDLPGLVRRLLERAAELPARLVQELAALGEALGGGASPRGDGPRDGAPRLVQLGGHLLAVVAVVVILGNLVYPDAVYGKGAAIHGGHGGFLSAGHAAGAPAPPAMARFGGFRFPTFGRGRTLDETGAVLTSRRYPYMGSAYGGSYHSHARNRFASPAPTSAPPSPQQGYAESVFRLSPELDLLDDGRLVLDLDGLAYCVLGERDMPLVDQATGRPMLALARPPALFQRAQEELKRQEVGLAASLAAKERWDFWMDWLAFFPGAEEDRTEAAQLGDMKGRLAAAGRSLGPAPDGAPAPPCAGARELFNGVWLLPDGAGLAAQLPQGRLAVLRPSSGWFADCEGRTPLAMPEDAPLRAFFARYLSKELADDRGAVGRLTADLAEAKQDWTDLQQDRAEYAGIVKEDGPGAEVEYGTERPSASEALRRTEAAIARTEALLLDLRNQIADQPSLVSWKQALLAALQGGGRR